MSCRGLKYRIRGDSKTAGTSVSSNRRKHSRLLRSGHTFLENPPAVEYRIELREGARVDLGLQNHRALLPVWESKRQSEPWAGFPPLQKAFVCTPSGACEDGDISSLENLMHLGDFLVDFLLVVLDNAERVDPDIFQA